MVKRRGNNEGTIYKTEDGNWRVQVTLNGQRLSHTSKNKQECQQWLKNTIGQIDSGLTYVGANMRLADYMALWLGTITENRRIKTYIQYKDVSERFLLPKFGGVLLKDLHPVRIEAFFASLKRIGIGDRTVQLCYAILHACLHTAVRKGLIGRNPLDAVEKPKVLNPRKKVIMDIDQVQQFLIAATGEKYEILFHLAVSTGMREGEILGLKWTDIDWRKSVLKVQRQIQRVPGQGLVFSDPKTEAGNRIIALGQTTLSKLVDMRTQQDIQRQFSGSRWQETGLIFTTLLGTPIDPRNLLTEFKRILNKANLPMMRFHDLRHTSITLLLNEMNAPIKEAQHRAGHSRPSTTMDIYAGEINSKIDSVMAEGLDNLITPIQVKLESKKKINAEGK